MQQNHLENRLLSRTASLFGIMYLKKLSRENGLQTNLLSDQKEQIRRACYFQRAAGYGFSYGYAYVSLQEILRWLPLYGPFV